MQITRWRQNGLLRKRTVRISTLAALLAVGASFASLQVSGLSVGVDGCATTIYFDYQSAHADSAAAAVAELAPFVEQLDPDLPEHSRTRFAALGWAAKRALTTSDEGNTTIFQTLTGTEIAAEFHVARLGDKWAVTDVSMTMPSSFCEETEETEG